MADAVLVAGALGIVGRATMAHAITAGKDVIGLSRRAPPAGTPGRFVSVDLTNPAECAAKLGSLAGISHIVYAALFEKPDLGAGWLEADQIATNLAMLRNLLDAVEPANPSLKHVTVLQGAKAYGVHLGQIPIPARESAPRHIHPNFYWAQEDLIRERQARAGWAWTIFRPQVVLGFAPGSAMNMLAAIGAYAAISRALGLPHPMPLATVMPGKAQVWDALVRQHGLAANTLEGLVGSSWQFADFAFSRTHSTASLLSTIKIRQAGFADCIDTEESLGWELAELQRQRVLPP